MRTRPDEPYPASTISLARSAIAVVAALVIAAVITPPDPFTQLAVGIPMILLYEVGILLARLSYRPPSEERQASIQPGASG